MSSFDIQIFRLEIKYFQKEKTLTLDNCKVIKTTLIKFKLISVQQSALLSIELLAKIEDVAYTAVLCSMRCNDKIAYECVKY